MIKRIFKYRFCFLTFGLLLSCLVPITFWAISYHWQITQNYQAFDLFLFLITETSSMPIFIITFILLSLLLVGLYFKNIHWKVIILAVLLVHGSVQGIKIISKKIFKEPRPFITQLFPDQQKVAFFYKQSKKEKFQMVSNLVKEDKNTPNWLKNHWKQETGYSFPSGHTAFSIAWLMLFLLFLPFNISRLTVFSTVIVFIWSCLVLVSRVRLGMHYPIDLLASTLTAFIITLIISTSKYLCSKNYQNK